MSTTVLPLHPGRCGPWQAEFCVREGDACNLTSSLSRPPNCTCIICLFSDVHAMNCIACERKAVGSEESGRGLAFFLQ